jgi:hypothetical protein
LRLPQTAKVSALGGVNVSSTPKDAGMFMQNPALMHSENRGNLGINYTNYYANIAYLTTNHGFSNSKLGEFAAGMQYLNYGVIKSYDAAGNYLGEFSAQDYAISVAYSCQIRVFRLGVSLKYVGSGIAAYQSNGLLCDIGGVFIHPRHDFHVGLVVKNVGFAFSNYTDASKFNLPFDVQIGTSFKPKKMPLRFSLTMHHLYPTDITYNDPNNTTVDAEGNVSENNISFFDKLSRRFVVGGEIIFHANFQGRIAYNFLQRRELGIDNQSKGMTGLSFGAMLKIKGFEVNYSYNMLHIAGGLNTIGITVDTKKLFTKTK